MTRRTPLRPVLYAAILISVGLLFSGSDARAQAFEVPDGFLTEPAPKTGMNEGLKGILTVRPADGAFSDLTDIQLSEVTEKINDQDAWLKKRISVNIGDGNMGKDLFESPDSPFGDPAFEALRKALPNLFERLGKLGELPLEFCEDPTTGYNAAGEFRQLYCAFEFGPFRRFQVYRLQESDGHWYFTEIRTMNERRLRHLLAIANSFNM